MAVHRGHGRKWLAALETERFLGSAIAGDYRLIAKL